MLERIKDPKFWAMIIAACAGVITMGLNGEMPWPAVGVSVISSLLSGLLGVLQPVPVKALKAPKVP